MPLRTIVSGQAGALPIEAYREGPIGPFLMADRVLELRDSGHELPASGSQAAIFIPWLLQDIADYRGALQGWFACLELGGTLVLTVPHAFLFERQDGAPSRVRPAQRRLYTPRALIEEVEEALVPNSYRVRWLGDLDQGYDYRAASPAGQAEVALAIERIELPSWNLTQDIPAALPPVDLFEPDHLRIEEPIREPVGRILVLKLDHLGDFVMSLDALRRLRTTFPAAEITLVVGSWNEELARDLNVADQVIGFDAYPRNSSEEEPDIAGTRALFEAQITGRYDLAIDLRTNWDSRFLLRHVDAAIRAGLGMKAHFPFLDIFLPVDAHVDAFDTAWQEDLGPERFNAQPYCARSPFSVASMSPQPDQPGDAIIWGPYRPLPSGQYVFEPRVEVEAGRAGLMICDVALNTHRVAQLAVTEQVPIRLAFTNHVEQAQFEFRIYAASGESLPDFRFYGGRLSRRGGDSALHQSEYLILLVELIALRLAGRGLFAEIAR